MSQSIIRWPYFLYKLVKSLYLSLIIVLYLIFLLIFFFKRHLTTIIAFEFDFNFSFHDPFVKLAFNNLLFRLFLLLFSLFEFIGAITPFLEGKIISIAIHTKHLIFENTFSLFKSIATFPDNCFLLEKFIQLFPSLRIWHWNEYNFIYWGLKIF